MQCSWKRQENDVKLIRLSIVPSCGEIHYSGRVCRVLRHPGRSEIKKNHCMNLFCLNFKPVVLKNKIVYEFLSDSQLQGYEIREYLVVFETGILVK